MKYSIENQHISVKIQHKGAEICSLKSKKTNQEFMWDANPDIWGSYAPVLFPIIGLLKHDCYSYKGKEYSIPKHGFVRNNTRLELANKTEESLTLILQYNEETLKIYPFKFAFYITFELKEKTLKVKHRIENMGSEELLFSLGGHPAFRCPLNDSEDYTDYYLEFENTETADTWLLSDNGLISESTSPVLINTKKLELTKDMFDKDALIFKKLKSKKVTLKNSKNDTSLSLAFPDFKYLGIWAKPAAPFVCIEPWLGIADSDNSTGEFEKKEGIIKLHAHKSFEAEFDITIQE